MQARDAIDWAKTSKAFSIRLRRTELLALFPGLSVLGMALTSKNFAEVVGIVLPMLLAVDAMLQLLRSGQPDEDAKAAEDPTTGLPMRGALDHALQRVTSASPGTTTACMFVRLDDQEDLAQRWGPDARDEILRRTAERVRVAVRNGDVVAQVDRGTFGVVLEPRRAGPSNDVSALAKRIQTSITEPIYIEGGRARITACIGIATPDPLPVSDLLIGAEAAVTEARHGGKGCIQNYSSDLQSRLSRVSELTRSVDMALAQGEFKPWFQPQIDNDTGAISGFEALARWHHPVHGVLNPGQFLDPVSDAGRLNDLGEVILAESLSALKSWDDLGLKVPSVAVNFSAEELRDPYLSDRIQWEVDRHDLRPARLTIEILENVAADSPEDQILQNVDALAALGFNLDLDDFGTGQASIANIRRFRVQRIKIDRSFITNVDSDAERQSVLAAILSMAEHLGVETLAEGVETTAEHSLLAQLGCGYVQGFGLARPMPADDVPGWIEKYRARVSELSVPWRRTG